MGLAAALVACLVGVRLLAAGDARAWGVEATHETIYDRAIVLADQDDEFSLFLSEQLGLRHGRAEGLAVQIGFDTAIDLEIGPICAPLESGCDSRLLASQNLFPDFLSVSPEIVRIALNPRCPPTGGAAFDECFADLERFAVARLIRLGVWAEDNPNPRARHHFHDPVFPRPPPPDNHGLNDQIRYLEGVDVSLADFVTSLLRGGDPVRWLRSFTEDPDPDDPDPDLSNFELRGRSSVDRALNRPLSSSFPSTRSPENLFALPDVERYLYRALTAPREDEREHYLALHFIGFGHVSHLLQDSSSPGHVRNDFVVEHIRHVLDGFESVGDKPDIVASALGTIGEGNLFQNVPASVMSSAGEGDSRWLSDLSGFDFDPRTRDISGFWDEGSLDSPDGGGLAEIANRHVLSAGSAANTDAPPVNGYPNPLIPDCSSVGSTGSGALEVWTADLPMRDLQTGAVDPTRRSRYVSNRMFPHLGLCRLHAIMHEGVPVDVHWEVRTIDESVQRDYLDTLWRLAVNFQRKLIQKYYRPRIQLVPQIEGVFKLANLTGQTFNAASDAVELVYEDVDGNRQVVPISCSAAIELEPAPSDEEPGPEGPGICFMPAEGSLPSTPAVRDDFWVVVRGQLGERGSPAVDTGNPDGWKTEDFVVAFQRMRPQILYNRSLAEIPAHLGTDLQKVDVMRVSIEPLVGITEETDASGLRVDPGFEPVNLTDPIRQDAGDPELDFTAPQSAPMGGRVAIRTDFGSEPEEANAVFTDIRAPLDVFVFDTTLPPTDPDVLIAIPDSRIDESQPLLEEYRINWTLDESAIFFATEGFAGPHNRHDFSSGTTTVFADGFARAANFEPDVDINDLDVGTVLAACIGAREIAPRTATEVAVSSECSRSEVVTAPAGNNSTTSLDRSPEIMLMTVVPNADDSTKLDGEYTHRIDVDSGQIVSCGTSDDCWNTSGFNGEFSPVWSPDGTKLAFLRLRADEIVFFDDAGFELWIADRTTNQVKPLVVLDPENDNVIFSPSWSPGGDWIVFGRVGDTFNTNELYAVRADTTEVRTPRPMTRGAKVGATLSWEKTKLLLPAQ